MAALKHLHTNYPNGRWWIKADGTDLQEGLRESVKNLWSGDVDFGDGDLEKRHAEYINYLKFVRCVGLNSRAPLNCIEEDLKLQLAKLNNEKEFLRSAHIEAKKVYDKLRQTPSTSENSMFASAWNLEEYSALLNKNQSLMQSATSIIHIIESRCTHAMNIRSAICSLRSNLVEYVKGTVIKY